MFINQGLRPTTPRRAKLVPFLFVPDNVFNYRCAGCGLCCKGNGIQMDMEREGKLLLKRHPQLRYFFLRGERYETYNNLHGDCWFFESDSGLCQIERELGRAEKPWYCQLFPYDVLGVRDGRLLMSLHTSCPVSLDPRDGGVWLGQADFMAQFDELDLGYCTLFPQLSFPRIDLAREAEIIAECSQPDQAPDYLALAVTQARIYGADAGMAEGVLSGVYAAWQQFFEEETELSAAAVHQANRHMAAITPILRGRFAEHLEQLPTVLLAVYFLVRQSLALRPQISAKQISAISGLRIISAMANIQRVPTLAPSNRTAAAYFRKLPADLQPCLRQLETLLLGNTTARLPLAQIFGQIAFRDPAQKIRLLNAVPENYMNLEFADA